MEREIIWKDRKRTIFGLPWSFTKYSLTKDRFFIEKGIFNVREDEVRLYRVTDVSLTRTFGQRIFGLGTISCCSADKTLGDFKILNIKNSKEVKELLSEAIEKERMAKRVISKEDFGHDHSDDGDDSDMDDSEVN
ncbi:MAG: PH domain-containing protein [Thermoflexaceae bacterium]|nr:PH domain-containing protein [Thermoflexaceae bacterium]